MARLLKSSSKKKLKGKTMSLFATITVVVLALAGILAWRANYWYKEGRKLQQDGYLPPNPTIFGQLLLKLVSAYMCFRFVGPVKVLNWRNAFYKGRLNIVPNHQFELDFMVVAKALPYGFRHLGARDQMSTGPKAALAAYAGFFSVNTEGGKAQSGGNVVVKMLGKVLALHPRSRLMMFFQGRLVRDNILTEEDSRTGAIRALISARDDHGIPEEELALLPVAVKYLRDEKYRTWYHKLMLKLGRKKFRSFKMHDTVTKNCRAVVNLGKPIPLADLPDDPREAINHVRGVIQGLLDEIEAGL